jgi:hypothetical protein
MGPETKIVLVRAAAIYLTDQLKEQDSHESALATSSWMSSTK